MLVRSVSVCPTCHGRGQIIDEPCPECQSSGEIQREEVLTVNVPIGVEEGMALRIPGHGMPSEEKGGVPGDLFVIVHTKPDPRFERAGADLWREEIVTVPEAVLGTLRTVPTLYGNAEVTIPPGTQPDSVLRLAGKGLPEFGGRSRGDLYLRLRIRIPEHLSARERELYQQLRALAGAGSRSHAPHRGV